MGPSWTITELAEAAVAALGHEPVQVNGRVRDMPNERLIRWYTTIGLVDPPSARRGRTALYGDRHLLQLVAIKRRQAAGRTIAQIQTELLGATDTALRQIAQFPEPTHAQAADGRPTGDVYWSPPAGEERSTDGRERFWARGTHRAAADTPRAPSPVPAGLVSGVRLAPGVTLMLDTTAISQADLEAIALAAEPLLEELRRRGLRPAVGHHDPASSTDSNRRHH